jgi:hypothetical protein
VACIAGTASPPVAYVSCKSPRFSLNLSTAAPSPLDVLSEEERKKYSSLGMINRHDREHVWVRMYPGDLSSCPAVSEVLCDPMLEELRALVESLQPKAAVAVRDAELLRKLFRGIANNCFLLLAYAVCVSTACRAGNVCGVLHSCVCVRCVGGVLLLRTALTDLSTRDAAGMSFCNVRPNAAAAVAAQLAVSGNVRQCFRYHLDPVAAAVASVRGRSVNPQVCVACVACVAQTLVYCWICMHAQVLNMCCICFTNNQLESSASSISPFVDNLSNGEFEAAVQTVLRESFGEQFSVQRGSANLVTPALPADAVHPVRVVTGMISFFTFAQCLHPFCHQIRLRVCCDACDVVCC